MSEFDMSHADEDNDSYDDEPIYGASISRS
jgi:hypothetical protein